MKTLRMMMATMAAFGLLAGCAADVGEGGAPLVRVDRGTISAQILFMAPELSEMPLTAVELEELGVDESEAIPVRVEIFDTVAVAWFAPDGEALIDREAIVALWRVRPMSGEVETEGSYDVTEPPTIDATGYVRSDTQTIDGLDSAQEVESTPYDAVEERIIEFFDRAGTPEEFEMIREIGAYHPGCL